jgi:RNA polymerase sigma-70 factor (ECF subfamily)
MLDFDSLYRKYAPDVFRFALYLSGNRAEAEDIASETFARAWVAHGAIQAESAKGYLFTIARNLFLKSLRSAARRSPLAESLPDPAPRSDQLFERKSELNAVLAAMQTLPDIDRAALVMRSVDGLPYREIARVLGISEGAAKVKVHRARALLMHRRNN